MTSIPLPGHSAKKDYQFGQPVPQSPPPVVPSHAPIPSHHSYQSHHYEHRTHDTPKMSFKSVLAFFSKKEKRQDKHCPREEVLKIEEVDETRDSVESEDKSEESRSDDPFVRTTLRQSIKRAKEWRKSQRKAVNKRKKENIQNSKLLTGGEAESDICSEDIDHYYEDSELDAVIVTDSASVLTPEHQNDNPSKIPKIKHANVKRPTMSIRSAGFFSQSVTTKKTESGIPVYTNKASALRKEAALRKLESGSDNLPQPVATTRKKQRASFRTKKGIARKPVTARKEIKPTENKAYRLRAKKVQEINQKEEQPAARPEQRIKPDRLSSAGVKTPAPKSAPSTTDTSDPLIKSKGIPKSRTSESIASTSSSLFTRATSNSLRSRIVQLPTKSLDEVSSMNTKPPKISSEQVSKATPPQKPSRTRIVTGASTPPRSLPIPRITHLHDSASAKPSEHTTSPKYSAKSAQKCYSPKLRTETCFSPIAKPSQKTTESTFSFIPLDTPAPPEQRPKIDEVTRKRRLRHPATNTTSITISNIFDGGAGDFLPRTNRTSTIHDDDEHSFTVHVNTPPSPFAHKIPATAVKTKSSKPTKPNTNDTHLNKYKRPTNSPVRGSRSPQGVSPISQPGSCSSKNSPANKTYNILPKPTQRTCPYEAERRSSLESCKRPKKGSNPVRPVSYHSNSYNSENSDLENSGSFESYKSYENDQIFDDDILDNPPILSESPRFRNLQEYENRVNISIDDLEKQKQYLRSTPFKSGTIRVSNIKSRRSWLKTDDLNIFDQSEKEKIRLKLDEEMLKLEDLTSGHDDVVQTLASRTSVLKKVISLQRSRSFEKSARLIVSLSFPRTHFDEEFKSLKRSYQCTTDDTALFENCLGILLNDRSNVTLPVLATLTPKLRYTFEILGTKVLRSHVEDTIKYLISNFGHKITHPSPGSNYRLRDDAETCNTELNKIKTHIDKLINDGSEHVAELLALKKQMEIFDGS